MTQMLTIINETQNEEVEFGKRQRLKNGEDFLCLCSTSTTTCRDDKRKYISACVLKQGISSWVLKTYKGVARN